VDVTAKVVVEAQRPGDGVRTSSMRLIGTLTEASQIVGVVENA
jgi:hypothetical protein